MRERGGLLERVSWVLVRAGELAEGNLAVRRRDRWRYAFLLFWCAVLGAWLAVLRLRRSVLRSTEGERI